LVACFEAWWSTAVMCGTSLASPLSEGSSSGRKLCPDPRVGADDGGVYGRRFPSWRHYRGFSLPTMAWSLRVKTQASVSRSGRRRRLRRIPLVGVALESQLWRLCVASPVGVSGRWGSGPGCWLCVEAAASEFMVGRCFMRWSSCLHGLGDCLVSLVRRGCRLGRRCLG
jgi:hypothetical protein